MVSSQAAHRITLPGGFFLIGRRKLCGEAGTYIPLRNINAYKYRCMMRLCRDEICPDGNFGWLMFHDQNCCLVVLCMISLSEILGYPIAIYIVVLCGFSESDD